MKVLRIYSGLPTSIAAALRVFTSVCLNASTNTLKDEPSKVVSLSILDLHLDFTCDSAEVSWDLIAFVRAMLDATKRGFTGKFKAIVFHGPTETVVNVALRIRGPADPNDSTETNTGL